MEFLEQFTLPAVVAICLCVGYILKNLVPTDKINRFIPLIAGLVGVGITVWSEMAISPEILLNGLASGLASTGLYEAFHQFIKK